MIQMSSLSHSVAGQSLFENLNLILSRSKHGLVGPNGVGKTTLALLLAGRIQPTEGQIIRRGEVVYLQQEEDRKDQPLSEFLSEVWECSQGLIAELVKDLDLSRNLQDLSGGEWMRARLARVLTQPFAFLILDEPSNNLDRAGKEKLIQFVDHYRGGLLLISHDRELLERTDQILELSNQGLTSYGGNFSFYWQMRKEERERQGEELERLKRRAKKSALESEEKIRRQEKRMRKGREEGLLGGIPRIARGLRQRNAQVSMGKIAKHEDESASEKRKALAEAVQAMKIDPFVRLDFGAGKVPPGKILAAASEVNFRFTGQKNNLWSEPVQLTIRGQERWHLQGASGSGKSTLIKLLLGRTLFGQMQGSVRRNSTAIVDLDQNYSALDSQQSLLGNLSGNSRLSEEELRNELAFYGFREDKVFQPVATLSGGERLKASLAKMFLGLQIPELIVLDEPTNNLDLAGIELLEKAIARFQGALLVISHDRRFMEAVAPTHVLWLK